LWRGGSCNATRSGTGCVMHFVTGFDVRSWTVSRYLREIEPGDEAAMRISGPSAGVYALAEITSSAEQSADDPDPYWADPAAADEVSWHIGIRLSQTPPGTDAEIGAGRGKIREWSSTTN
jgi:hypothetical protein